MQSASSNAKRAVTVSVVLLTLLLVVVVAEAEEFGIAVVPAVAVGLLFLLRPALGLMFLALLIPFEDTLLFGGGSTLTKAAGLLVAGAWVLHKLVRRESWTKLVTSPAIGFLVLLIGLAFFSIAWAQWPKVVFPRAVRLCLFIALCVLAFDLTRRWADVQRLLRAIVCGGLVAAVMVVLQYNTGLVRRAGGDVAGDVNQTALIMVVILPLAFALVRSRTSVVWRIAGLAYIGLAVIGIAQTLSRMAYLVTTAILMWELLTTLRERRTRWIAGVAMLLILGAGLRFLPIEAVTERARTIGPYLESTVSAEASGTGALSGRGYHLLVALRIFQDHPVLGVGFSNFGHYFLQYQYEVAGAGGIVYIDPRSAHSAYMALLADLGLLGVLFWLPFLILVIQVLVRTSRRLRLNGLTTPHVMVRGIGLSFAIFLAYGFYSEFQLQKLFWLLAGTALSLGWLPLGDDAETSVGGVEADADGAFLKGIGEESRSSGYRERRQALEAGSR